MCNNSYLNLIYGIVCLCVLIVFLLHQESLKLILVDEPLIMKWFYHTSLGPDEALFLYVAATIQVISAALVVEWEEPRHVYKVQRLVYHISKVQRSVYYISKVLSNYETRYNHSTLIIDIGPTQQWHIVPQRAATPTCVSVPSPAKHDRWHLPHMTLPTIRGPLPSTMFLFSFIAFFSRKSPSRGFVAAVYHR
jgi:hypothetical protein